MDEFKRLSGKEILADITKDHKIKKLQDAASVIDETRTAEWDKERLAKSKIELLKKELENSDNKQKSLLIQRNDLDARIAILEHDFDKIVGYYKKTTDNHLKIELDTTPNKHGVNKFKITYVVNSDNVLSIKSEIIGQGAVLSLLKTNISRTQEFVYEKNFYYVLEQLTKITHDYTREASDTKVGTKTWA